MGQWFPSVMGKGVALAKDFHGAVSMGNDGGVRDGW